MSFTKKTTNHKFVYIFLFIFLTLIFGNKTHAAGQSCSTAYCGLCGRDTCAGDEFCSCTYNNDGDLEGKCEYDAVECATQQPPNICLPLGADCSNSGCCQDSDATCGPDGTCCLPSGTICVGRGQHCCGGMLCARLPDQTTIFTCGGDNPTGPGTDMTGTVSAYDGPIVDLESLISNVYRILIPIAIAIVAVPTILTSAYKIMTSQGDPAKVKDGRDGLTAGVFGVIFLGCALIILRWILVNFIGLT